MPLWTALSRLPKRSWENNMNHADKHQISVLDFESLRSLAKSIDPSQYLEWTKNALWNQNRFVNPAKSRINQEAGNYYAVMPYMDPEENKAMVKMIGRHVLKPGEQRSVMMSDLMLYEADSGILLALMDGEYLTTLRTGACAAYSALLYGKKDFDTIGLIGLGNIMCAAMDVLLPQLKDRKITIKLYKHHDQEKRFKERYKHFENITFEECDTYEQTIGGSDLILSALTRTDHDFCDLSNYKEGCTVIPIMTMGFQNCDTTFDKVFTDEIEQIRGFKYFNQFRSIANTTDVLHGLKPGRENDQERILVYNYGLALLDLYFANQLLKKADDQAKVIPYNYCSEKFFM